MITRKSSWKLFTSSAKKKIYEYCGKPKETLEINK